MAAMTRGLAPLGVDDAIVEAQRCGAKELVGALANYRVLLVDLVSPIRATHFCQSRLRRSGVAYTGLPWPVRPLAASLRLDPLHSTGVRTAERGDSPAWKFWLQSREPPVARSP